jgi:thiamine biosynthesis lipoprotein
MKDTRLIMGMPITVEVVDAPTPDVLDTVFAYFTEIDERFSTYKETSEISRLNEALVANVGAPQRDGARAEQFLSKEIAYPKLAMSAQLQEILELAEKTKQETHGYFDIQKPGGGIDPSGIVKGWAIKNAAELLDTKGYRNFYIEAGGDIQARGKNTGGVEWSVGIRHPFAKGEIIKVIYPSRLGGAEADPRDKGVATSGSYERGNHIYNPHSPDAKLEDVVSITVIGPNVLEADRFATAAFAMGQEGVQFIESLAGFEAYSIDSSGIATMTSGFSKFTI